MRIRHRLVLIAAALLALASAEPAGAAITVANQSDSGPGSLRQAIAEAPPGETIVVPPGDYTLTSEPLKITKSVTIAGHGSADTTIRAGGAFGVLAITGPLDATISGVTIRDGDIVAPAAQGAGVHSLKANLTLRDDVLTHNTADANGAAGVSGGAAQGAAIWAIEGSLALTGCALTGNAATALGGSGKNGGATQGGAIWLAGGPLTIANTTISGNRLDGSGGQGPPSSEQNGGVAMGAGIWAIEGDLTLNASDVSGNSAVAMAGPGANGGVAQGGAIWHAHGSAGLAEARIEGNLLDSSGGPAAATLNGGVAQGGGIWSVEGPFSLSRSELSGNTALASGGSGGSGGVAQGGGAWVASPLATIANTTVNGNRIDARGGQGASNPNQAGGVAQGGGVWLSQEKTTTPSSVAGSTVAGNTADGSAGPGAKEGVAQGGGVWAAASQGPLAVIRSTIASNVARLHTASAGSASGGGLWGAAAAPGSLALTSATIAANALDVSGAGFAEGGNLFWSKDVTIGNSIVAHGLGPAGSENCSKPPEGASLGFNLESADQCGFHAAGDLTNRDPLLGPLQDNGGPTPTMAPASNSPAIDQGAGLGLGADQRGVVRPIDFPSIPNSSAPGADGSDIGAVELQPSNALALGKLKRNRRKGTATLTVLLPQPSAGALTLHGKGLKTQRAAITGQARVKLKVIGRGAVKKALRKRGKRKVRIQVTYAPSGNVAATANRKAKLVQKPGKRKKRRANKSRL